MGNDGDRTSMLIVMKIYEMGEEKSKRRGINLSITKGDMVAIMAISDVAKPPYSTYYLESMSLLLAK